VALTMGDSGRNGAEVEGCWYLHRIADLERELYGDILSASARDYVEGEPIEAARLGPYSPGGIVPPPRPPLLRGCHAHWITVEYH
jgi:hypothetical protein